MAPSEASKVVLSSSLSLPETFHPKICQDPPPTAYCLHSRVSYPGNIIWVPCMVQDKQIKGKKIRENKRSRSTKRLLWQHRLAGGVGTYYKSSWSYSSWMTLLWLGWLNKHTSDVGITYVYREAWEMPVKYLSEKESQYGLSNGGKRFQPLAGRKMSDWFSLYY